MFVVGMYNKFIVCSKIIFVIGIVNSVMYRDGKIERTEREENLVMEY